MKRVLVLHYSQSGQLNAVVRSVVAPLQQAEGIEVVLENLRPAADYPFPWPVIEFFNTFPETVYEDAPPLQPLSVDPQQKFDLIILAYQVWFLSPSLPVAKLLNSPEAKPLFANTPVVTLIACRNMWLTAQEKVKAKLQALKAPLIDNIVLTDNSHSALTFISTPAWVLSGNKGPFLGGLIPAAGVPDEDIANASRFGRAIAAQLPQRERDDTRPMLSGLGAVTIFERLIASEKIAHRSFQIWGRMLRALGGPQSLPRKCLLLVYILFLLTMILTVVPITALLKILTKPLNRGHTARQRAYYAAPSGEEGHLLENA